MFRAALSLSLFLCSSALADVWTFETPTENIQCSVGQEANFADIHCRIIERYGPTALPRPANCGADWGHSFVMNDTGPARMLCEPLRYDRDGWDRAEYGVVGRFGGFTCNSTRNGLDCRNRDGHGFFLSRAVQRVF